ncbi:MAG: TetR family transcriptional regulator [Actinophytocola sp.]|uniref:TetR/AcrR family transcriptional regulator n=1 Tax=Actinophytocola sp. TaxID=1872138 RepID=UPI00132CAECF|nr:TetR/AcrR family transcriptional regulator [Actinophytocola sp.]MPZ79616.1 TetR family transcriptional regulator [Actinophytocola sp.]
MSESGTGLPASFELAWGVRARPTKGPKAALSLERVVAAGVTVAAAEGIGAVSMSRVAKELGTSAMALYRYVSAKDELLALMVDAALGPMPQVAGDDGWRPGLERWSWAELAAYRRHLWVLQVPISGPPVTPNTITFLEQGLRCLAGTPLHPGEKMSVILTLTSYTRSWAMLSAQIDAALSSGDPTAIGILANYGKILGALTDPAEFPALREVLDAEVFEPAEELPDEDFVFGLARLLDGIAVLIDGRG